MRNKNRMKKMTALVLGGLTAVCMMTACGSTGGNTDATATGSAGVDEGGSGAAKQVTMILDWTPNTNHTGIYVAKELGYYEEAGLDVAIELPAEELATQLVGAGKGDFGIGNTEDVIHAISMDDPMPVESVAAIIQHNTSGFVSLKEEGISSPADWEGKTYGGYGGSTEEKIVRNIAQENGVDPDSIQFVTLGDADTLTSLKKDIDFIWVFEAAELISLDNQGVEYNYLPVRDYGEAFDYYTPCLITNSNVAEKDPEMVKAFVEATAKGYQYAIENPEEAAEILLNAEPELDEYIVTEGQKYLSERYALDAPQWGYQDADVWQKYADFLYQNELIENEVDVNTAFTNEFLPES